MIVLVLGVPTVVFVVVEAVIASIEHAGPVRRRRERVERAEVEEGSGWPVLATLPLRRL